MMPLINVIALVCLSLAGFSLITRDMFRLAGDLSHARKAVFHLLASSLAVTPAIIVFAITGLQPLGLLSQITIAVVSIIWGLRLQGRDRAAAADPKPKLPTAIARRRR